MRKLINASIIMLTSIALSSCGTYKESVQNVKQTQQQIKQARQDYQTTPQPVVIKAGYYVDDKPMSLKRPAGWLSQHVEVQANQLPFSMLMDRLLRNTGVGVSYDKSIAKQQLVSFNYHGTLQGALDQIANQTHYTYQFGAREVNWSAFKTRTFDVDFMPGTSNYLVGQSQSQNQQNNQNGNQSIDRINDQQYSNMSGQLSVWNDIRSTLNEMKSKQGQVFVSESTSSITVTDHPDNVRNMARYVNRLNQTLSKQVLVKVQVLEVDLSKDYNYGIDWNAVANTLGTTFKFTGNLASGTNLIATNLISNSATSTQAGLQIGSDATHTLISALSQQGHVSVVTKPEVMTMNDQIASIRITQDTGYIQSVNSSYTENYVSTSITPGTVTAGFTLYVLPRIENNRVFMQISSRIADLVALQKESTEPTSVENGTQSISGNQQFNAIEVPTITAKEFNQRSVVPSGSTMIIAGYKRLRNQAVNAKFFGLSPLGGQGAKDSNIETLVLITPIIMKSNS